MTKTVTDPSADLEAAITADRAAREALEARAVTPPWTARSGPR